MVRRTLGPLLLAAFLGLLLTGHAGPAAALGARALCGEELAFGVPRRLHPAKRGALGLLCERNPVSGESYFLVAYDKRRRAPLWTAYRLTAAEMEAAAQSGITRRANGSAFHADARLVLPGQGIPAVSGSDYRGAGRDRGHLVPAAAMAFDPEAYAASFTVANLALQDAALNRGAWRRLEALVRDWARTRGAVHVITGAVFDATRQAFAPLEKPQVRIAVPEAFYKVIYDPAAGTTIAFLYANAPPLSEDLGRAALSVDRLEAFTGHDFFPLMPQTLAGPLEAAAPDLAAWGLRETVTPPGE